jgi:hypothetical protein
MRNAPQKTSAKITILSVIFISCQKKIRNALPHNFKIDSHQPSTAIILLKTSKTLHGIIICHPGKKTFPVLGVNPLTSGVPGCLKPRIKLFCSIKLSGTGLVQPVEFHRNASKISNSLKTKNVTKAVIDYKRQNSGMS